MAGRASAKRTVACLVGVAATTASAIGLGGHASAAETDAGIRPATRAEARAFLSNTGRDGPLACTSIGFSRSNERWALVSPTDKCGANSGHSVVYRLNRSGDWTYLFYDMENDGCERFGMPQAVRRDFSRYVC